MKKVPLIKDKISQAFPEHQASVVFEDVMPSPLKKNDGIVVTDHTTLMNSQLRHCVR